MEVMSFSALDTNDDFTQLKASQILTVLLSSEPSPLPLEILTPFLNTLTSIILASNSTTVNRRDVAVQCLESLLTRPEVRSAVWEKPKILSGSVHRCLRKDFLNRVLLGW